MICKTLMILLKMVFKITFRQSKDGLIVIN